MERDELTTQPHVADALRRLSAAAIGPPADPAREAALMAAFDAEHGSTLALSERRESKGTRRGVWHLAAFAAAAAVLIAVGIAPVGKRESSSSPQRPSATLPSRQIRLEPPNDFVMMPDAVGLPPMESGTLVRMDVPVSMLPTLGVTPPPGQAVTVTADFIVAQDGLPRAVRVVAP